MSKKLSAIPLCLTLLLGSSVKADTVVLNSGGVILDCKVVSKSGRFVVVRTPSGRMTVPREVIKKIRRENSIFEQYEKKRSRINKRNYKKLFKLARWCKKHTGLRPEMLELSERVLALKPSHRKARRLLGYFREGKKWVKAGPLALNVKLSKVAEKISPSIPDRVSLSLADRPDFEMSWDNPKGKSLNTCTLCVSTEERSKGATLFYGTQIQGGQTVVVVKLIARSNWLGRKGVFVELEGTVPAEISNSEGLAVQDAFTRNAAELTRFLDRIRYKRMRALEATAAKARAIGNGV